MRKLTTRQARRMSTNGTVSAWFAPSDRQRAPAKAPDCYAAPTGGWFRNAGTVSLRLHQDHVPLGQRR
jgi:hypothetical protein